jgi:hypothetical protein
MSTASLAFNIIFTFLLRFFSTSLDYTYISLNNTLTSIFDFTTFPRSSCSYTTATTGNGIGTFSAGGLTSTALGSYSIVDAFDFGTSTTGTGN